MQEVATKCPLVRGPLSVVHDIHDMISSSLKRLNIVDKMLASLSANVAGGHLKPLCLTCWTCRTKALSSLLNNYEVVYHTLDKIVSAGGNTEPARKAPGVKTLMTQFEVHLGLKICLHLCESFRQRTYPWRQSSPM